jgi:hypothetical protein
MIMSIIGNIISATNKYYITFAIVFSVKRNGRFFAFVLKHREHCDNLKTPDFLDVALFIDY